MNIIELVDSLLYMLPILTFIALVSYAWFTYLIAREINVPVSSIFIKQGFGSHLNFYLKNFSKVETESFVKIWVNTEKGIFEFNEGPYGNKSPWISEPFVELNGNFELQEMVNKKNEKLKKYVKSKEINTIKFIVHRKYRKLGKKKWIVSKPQRWIYNFDTQKFWLDIGFNPKP